MSEWDAFPLASATPAPPAASPWAAFPVAGTMPAQPSGPREADPYAEAMAPGATGAAVPAGPPVSGANLDSDVLRQIAHGALRGVAGLGDLALTGGRILSGEYLTDQVLRNLPPDLGLTPPPTFSLTGALESVIPRPEPESTLGRYAGTAAEWAAGSMLPVGGGLAALARQAGLGALGGLGAEAAGSAARGTPLEQPVRIAAGIGSMLAAHGVEQVGRNALGLPTGAVGAILRNRLDPAMTPADWAAAADREAAARGIGVRLMGPESLAGPVGGGPLEGVVSDIAASRGGQAIRNLIQARPEAVRQAVQDRLLPSVGPQLPAEPVARRMQTSAEGAIQAAESARTAAARPGYAAADPQHLDPAVVQQMVDDIGAVRAAQNPTPGSALDRVLARLRSNLIDEAGNLRTQIAPLHNDYIAMRESLARRTFANEPIDSRTAGIARPLNRAVRDALVNNNPDYAAGRAAYIAASPAVDQIMASPVRDIAGRPTLETAPATGAPTDAYARAREALFPADPTTLRPEVIDYVGRQLARSDPAAFRDFTRLYLENEFNQAARQLRSGANPTGGARFYDQIASNPQQRANLEASLRRVAVVNGVNPDEYIQGWRTTMDVLDRTGRIPALGSRTGPRGELATEASQGPFAAVVDFRPGQPVNSALRLFGANLSDWVQRGNYRRLAEAFTAPDSVQRIRELAQVDPGSPRALLLVSTLLGLGRETAAGREGRQ